MNGRMLIVNIKKCKVGCGHRRNPYTNSEYAGQNISSPAFKTIGFSTAGHSAPESRPRTPKYDKGMVVEKYIE
jgi:hypothetical protein